MCLSVTQWVCGSCTLSCMLNERVVEKKPGAGAGKFVHLCLRALTRLKLGRVQRNQHLKGLFFVSLVCLAV